MPSQPDGRPHPDAPAKAINRDSEPRSALSCPRIAAAALLAVLLCLAPATIALAPATIALAPAPWVPGTSLPADLPITSADVAPTATSLATLGIALALLVWLLRD